MGVVDVLDVSMLAFMHAAIHIGTDSSGEEFNDGTVPLHARIREMEKMERTNKDSRRALVPPELACKAVVCQHISSTCLAIINYSKHSNNHIISQPHLHLPLTIKNTGCYYESG